LNVRIFSNSVLLYHIKKKAVVVRLFLV